MKSDEAQAMPRCCGRLKAGAKAYMLKRQVHRELLETIRAVHAGQKRIPSDLAAELLVNTKDT